VQIADLHCVFKLAEVRLSSVMPTLRSAPPPIRGSHTSASSCSC